jgi:hypothetical protein
MTEPRLPQIDPVTFSALNTLDNFIARAPLTRQEHAEANKCLQHIVQTIELLQMDVKQRPGTFPSPSPSCDGSTISSSNSPDQTGAVAANSPEANPGGDRMVAEIAEEIFRKAK